MGAKGIKNVFSNRNILVVSTTQILETFFSMVYTPFWTLFLMYELHFTIPMVALLHTIQSSENLLFSLPGGFLTDRIGRKKVTLVSATTRIISPIIYLTATSWEPVFIATLFVAMRSLGTPAYEAMVAESLPRDQMGTGYAILNMCRRAPGLFSGVIGGVLMDSLGLGPGTRLCLVGVLIGGVITFLARYFFLTETLVRTPGRRRNIVQDFKELLPVLKGSLRIMMVSSILFQISARLTSGLLVVYVTEYPAGPGLTNTEYGLLSTIMSIVSFIMALPGGTMADRYNRRKLITFGRTLHPLTTLAWIFFKDFYQILGMRLIQGIGEGISGAAGGMGGGAYGGGSAWSSLLADLVPMEKRGRYSGLLNTLSGIAALPAPNIGAWMWETEGVGPVGILWTQLFVGLSSTSLIWLFLKDPVRDVKKIEETAKDDGDKEGSNKKDERGEESF